MKNQLYIAIKIDLSDCYVCSDCTSLARYINVSTITVNRHLSMSNPTIVKGYKVWFQLKAMSARGKKR